MTVAFFAVYSGACAVAAARVSSLRFVAYNSVNPHTAQTHAHSLPRTSPSPRSGQR